MKQIFRVEFVMSVDEDDLDDFHILGLSEEMEETKKRKLEIDEPENPGCSKSFKNVWFFNGN